MTAQKTYYIMDDAIYTMDGLDSSSQAADRFRTAWAQSETPLTHMPLLRKDFRQTFVRLNSDAKFEGRLPLLSVGPDHNLLGNIPEESAARIYALFTIDPASYHMDADQEEYENDHIEPQLYVMETRAGEKRIRTIESLSLREFVKDNIDENDADRSILYRIRTQKHDHHLVHGDKIEQILKCIEERRGGRTGYQPEWTVDQIDQLERALEDHRQRTATPSHHP
jgi:hypothetical protein